MDDGDPLDIQQMLYTPEGKPRIAIFSIAHLGDAERMFFVSLLLNQVVGWMRAQAGTTSLRALLYMDEIFGYFPPVANPPSKAPLLTLLKQARAFGLGVVLATQNPVDLDYKGLSNAGTWFLGRLQTERDKARVLEGLEGAAATAGGAFDRGKMEQTLAGLGSRVFLMNNVHEDEPVVFETRWAMSYLRGPLGRQEIKRLMDPVKSARSPLSGALHRQSTPSRQSTTFDVSQRHVSDGLRQPSVSERRFRRFGRIAAPVLPPGIDQYFLPVRGKAPAGARLVYTPMLLGVAEVRFADAKARVDAAQTVTVATPVSDAPVPVDWNAAAESAFGLSDLEREAGAGAEYDPLPSAASKAKSYDAWKKSFGTWVYGAKKLELLRSAEPALVSQPGETEGQFRVRLQQAAREARDAAVDRMRQQYAPKIAALQERLRRAQAAQEREAGQASSAKLQTAISFGATLLGAFMGRKAVSMSSVGRATTAARGVGRSMKEAEDAKRAAESVASVQQQIDALEAELREQSATVELRMATAPLEALTVAPKKTGIAVQLVALTWVPYLGRRARRPDGSGVIAVRSSGGLLAPASAPADPWRRPSVPDSCRFPNVHHLPSTSC